MLNKLQAGPVDMLPAQISERTVPGGPTGPVSIHVVRPDGVQGDLPAVVYIHGGGWVLGNFKTHERLVRQIADGARATVVFVDYTPSPRPSSPSRSSRPTPSPSGWPTTAVRSASTPADWQLPATRLAET